MANGNQLHYSANLGFLWRDMPVLMRIAKAAEAGFEAIEFHDEAQEQDLVALQDTLDEFRLPVVSINTAMRGDSFGYAAVPGKEAKAHRDIDAAVEVARNIRAGGIHVMAGKADGPEAMQCYIDNLWYALANCGELTVLVEPISDAKVPGYFFNSVKQIMPLMSHVSHPKLCVLFDCFHVRHETEDVLGAFNAVADNVGHVQIASYPGRNEPDTGELDYGQLLPAMVAAGYDGFFGCEYRPAATVEEGLGWRERLGA